MGYFMTKNSFVVEVTFQVLRKKRKVLRFAILWKHSTENGFEYFSEYVANSWEKVDNRVHFQVAYFENTPLQKVYQKHFTKVHQEFWNTYAYSLEKKSDASGTILQIFYYYYCIISRFGSALFQQDDVDQIRCSWVLQSEKCLIHLQNESLDHLKSAQLQSIDVYQDYSYYYLGRERKRYGTDLR